MSSNRYLKTIVGICLIVGCVMLVHFTSLAELFNIDAMRSAILGYGIYGSIVYVCLYVLGSVFFIPGTPLTLLGGALFGPVYGTIYTVIGATLGACIAFWFARFFGRGLIRNQTGNLADRIAQYDARLSSHGFLTVIFLRVVPLFPFNGLNFALGLTSVRIRDYFLGTFIGIIPGTFAFVYFGDSLAELNVYSIMLAISSILFLTIMSRYLIKKYGTK